MEKTLDYLEKYTKYVLESAESNREMQKASSELERVIDEARRMKIDIFKNGNMKEKINLLIMERLQELENEEKLSKENLEKQISWIEQEMRI